MLCTENPVSELESSGRLLTRKNRRIWLKLEPALALGAAQVFCASINSTPFVAPPKHLMARSE